MAGRWFPERISQLLRARFVCVCVCVCMSVLLDKTTTYAHGHSLLILIFLSTHVFREEVSDSGFSRYIICVSISASAWRAGSRCAFPRSLVSVSVHRKRIALGFCARADDNYPRALYRITVDPEGRCGVRSLFLSFYLLLERRVNVHVVFVCVEPTH